MEVMATRVTATPTFITATITIMGMVIGGMVVGGAMASAPAGVGRPTVMSGSADTDSISTPAAFPARPPLATASLSAIDRRTWHNGVVPKLRDGQPARYSDGDKDLAADYGRAFTGWADAFHSPTLAGGGSMSDPRTTKVAPNVSLKSPLGLGTRNTLGHAVCCGCQA
jgi:hypothetical protein